jgi:Ni/Co efflux regulator RcnB
MRFAAAAAIALSLTATSIALADSRHDRRDDDSAQRSSRDWVHRHRDNDRDRDRGHDSRDRHQREQRNHHYPDRHYRDERNHYADRHYREQRDHYYSGRNYRDRGHADRDDRYRGAYGYGHHRWGRGERLPVAYYARPYVIHHYRDCGLYAPPRGHHWVRFNGDAILAAIVTGIVLDAVYDHFY